ncbi:MAG: hypothetical protein EAZ55_04655 [Cytophagales bacterium]|nr:MAG: hypothetical protein EAZ55_04655 [Cytophagales bacterium]
MIIIRLIVLLCIVGGLFSCVVQENIYFNEDYSGTMEYEVDAVTFMAMQGLDTLVGNDSNEDGKKEILHFQQIMDSLQKPALANYFESLGGISNYTLRVEREYEFSIRFDFADIQALNKAYHFFRNLDFSNQEMNVAQQRPSFEYFRLEGDVLVLNNKIIVPKQEEQNEEEGNYLMSGGSLSFATQMFFKHNIEEVQIRYGTGLDWEQREGSLKLVWSADEMPKESKQYAIIKIKLER